MGLQVVHAKRYRVTRERVLVASRKGKAKKPKYRTVTRRTPYYVLARDDRMSPDRAIPAAAKYLAGLEQKFGGRDWAIFAYHCGPGCVSEMQDLTRRARGISKDRITVPGMFFSCSPAWNRELYQAIEQQMMRDYSPTYYFRVRRAEQLLALYRLDADAFMTLADAYRSEFGNGNTRAPHRLAVWLKRDDMSFHTYDEIRADAGKRLVRALDRPNYYGYTLRLTADSLGDIDSHSVASPAALGTLAYIAFETRRLHSQMNPRGETFRPLPVTALVRPENSVHGGGRYGLSHSSGQVFDIDYSGLPPGELECLRFVLNDLGWDGYIGFIEEGRDSLHIGCSPTARDFFAGIFQEAADHQSTR